MTDYETNAAITGKKTATMSIGWVNAGPYDGTGPIEPSSNTAANTYNIFFSTSAGNGQRSHDSFASSQYSTGNYVSFGGAQYNVFGSRALPARTSPPTTPLTSSWSGTTGRRTGPGTSTSRTMISISTSARAASVAAPKSLRASCASATTPPTTPRRRSVTRPAAPATTAWPSKDTYYRLHPHLGRVAGPL